MYYDFSLLMFNWQKLCRLRQVTNDHQRNKYCFFLSSPLFDPAWITHMPSSTMFVYSMGWRKGKDAQQLEIQGGSLRVLAKFFLGVYLGLSRKSRGSPFCILLHLYVTKFFGSYPLPPPAPTPHVHLWEKVSWRSNLGLLFLPFSQFVYFLLLLVQWR